MKIPALMTILSVIAYQLAAQKICGTITNFKGQGLAGASVSIKDSYDGGTTDSSGRFCFGSSVSKEKLLVVSLIGFKTYEQLIGPITGTHLDIRLKEDISEMKAVVISAGSFEAGDKKKTTVFSSTDVLTTATNADVTNAIKTLPGTQQVGETAGLFVRGGTAAETRIYMDGVLIHNFFYSGAPAIAQRPRFNPMLFKGTVFSAGGYSALYGQGLSSALILESVDIPESSAGMVGLHVAGGSAAYQHINKKRNLSWGINYNYMNMGLAFRLIPQQQDYFKIPVYHNADANFRFRTGKAGMIKYFGYVSNGQLGLRTPDIDSARLKNAFSLLNVNTYQNLTLQQNFSGGWKLNSGISFTNDKDSISAALQDDVNQNTSSPALPDRNFRLRSGFTGLNFKVVIEKKWSGLNAVRFGNETNFNTNHLDYQPDGQIIPIQKVREILVAYFAEADVYLSNKLAAKIGSRYERSSVVDIPALAPRLSLAYKAGPQSQLSFAYGNFYQTPEARYLYQPARLSAAKATHFIGQFQKVTAGQTFRIEVYYKKYRQLVRVMNNIDSGQVNATGNGYARGFEVFWKDKKTLEGFDYWVSYSLLDTKRKYLNYPVGLQPDFTATHTLSAVIKRLFPVIKTQVNIIYSFASGRPYYNLKYNAGQGSFDILDKGKTINYNNLGISINYLPKLASKGAGKYTVLVLSVSNVLANRQVFGYKYSADGQRKVAITPASKAFIFLGFYISIGTDRTTEIINNL